MTVLIIGDTWTDTHLRRAPHEEKGRDQKVLWKPGVANLLANHQEPAGSWEQTVPLSLQKEATMT